MLVLGSGASVPYGYPTGATLKSCILDEIISRRGLESARQGSGVDATLSMLMNSYQPEHVFEFRQRFELSQVDSVDYFLREGCNDHLKAVGKAAMAIALIKCEQSSTLLNRDWYQYLWNYHLADEPGEETIRDTGLRVVTFNYDRSLEHFLFTAIRAKFNLRDPDAARLARNIPIEHVHGTLGQHPAFVDHGWRDYDDFLNDATVRKASTCIRIFSETNGHEDNLRDTWRYLKGAAVIGFLGFGFEPRNFEKLFCRETDWFSNAEYIFATSHGLTPSRAKYVRNLLGDRRKSITFVDKRCLDCLMDGHLDGPDLQI